MTDFMIHFLLCNLLLCGVITLFLLARRVSGRMLTAQMQYRLWFLLLFLLAAPFLPIPRAGLIRLTPWWNHTGSVLSSDAHVTADAYAGANRAASTDWINGFALSVHRGAPPFAWTLLFGIWCAGMLSVLLLAIRSLLRLCAIRKASLPLENPAIRSLYQHCLREAGISKDIPIHSTIWLTSPVITGLFHPHIYLPMHLISDCDETDLRYMLLHELYHYKHRDSIASCLMNLAGIVYWFHPLVWYALGEMRTDREIACDTSVLRLLGADSATDYGSTLISFAEKISRSPFPFATGLGGGMRQLKRRISSIARYEKPSRRKRAAGLGICALIACLLLAFTPALSVWADAEHSVGTDQSGKTISSIDLSSYFAGYDGCFVLLHAATGEWQIYNEDLAEKRISPDSTYKIYSALLALEQGIITPDSGDLTWDGREYPIAAWNGNQDLTSAFQNSVNWYFQALDQAAGEDALEDFYTAIDYGNRDLSDGISSSRSESSLAISPIEQVALLDRFYHNDFSFDADNVRAVKDALLLSSAGESRLYGKTGTGNVDGENIRGWLIGYVETGSDPYFFAVSIRGAVDAGGDQASKIALRILSDLGIYGDSDS